MSSSKSMRLLRELANRAKRKADDEGELPGGKDGKYRKIESPKRSQPAAADPSDRVEVWERPQTSAGNATSVGPKSYEGNQLSELERRKADLPTPLRKSEKLGDETGTEKQATGNLTEKTAAARTSLSRGREKVWYTYTWA
jgi:hypothetical protein